MLRGHSCLPLAILVAAAVGRARAQDTLPLPGQVSETSIAAGRELFHGNAGCSTCHGEQGVGTPDGPTLASGRWRLGDGSYPWLIHMTQHAGWGAHGRGDDPKPMRGPTGLDATQVSQVAGYVWFISREKTPAVGLAD
jgi:mono/diheme cytochrome c family protein